VALSAGCPAWVLPSTVPCGARTFLTLRPISGRPEAHGVAGRDRPAGLGAIFIITHHRGLSRGPLVGTNVRTLVDILLPGDWRQGRSACVPPASAGLPPPPMGGDEAAEG